MGIDDRTADQIQRDIERERADLSRTLNSLSDTLSFDSISSTLTRQVRGMGTEVMDDLAGTMIERARQKPVAAGLVLAGLAWMALGSSAQSSGRGIGHRSVPSGNPPSRGYEGSRSAADERIERLANDARILRDRVAEGTDALSTEARDRVVKAREAAAEAAERAVEAMRNGATKTRDVVQDNPFAIGGVALAIGAAIGGAMLLKKWEEEDREARNELFRQADRVMKDELEQGGSPRTTTTRA